MSSLLKPKKKLEDILNLNNEEFLDRISGYIGFFQDHSSYKISTSDVYAVLDKCISVIESRINENYNADNFATCINILKCINEIYENYDIFNNWNSDKDEHIFKLTSILNKNYLQTEITTHIQCLHYLIRMASCKYSRFSYLFKKFNGIEMICNFFHSDDVKVQSLVWKLVKRILKKDHVNLMKTMKYVLLDLIMDCLNGRTNLKIKIIAAEILLSILIYFNREMRLLTKDFNSVQILLNQVHFEHQELMKNEKYPVDRGVLLIKYLWCLLQLIITNEEKQFFRDIGGIPIILSLLNFQNYHLEQSLVFKNEVTDMVQKYFQIIEVSSTFISTLSKNENINLEIVQKSGIYIIAQLLINIPISSGNIENLQKHLFRVLRFLFSLERNRKKFKNIFPAPLYEAFVDIGHFCENLENYNQTIIVYGNLSEIDRKHMKESIECLNQKDEIKSIRDYIILELLGTGAFGSVYKARRKKACANSYCAIKEVNLSEFQKGSTSQERCDSIYQIASELEIIKKQFRHPHVVRYYRTFYDASNLYIVMAFLEGISLGEQINCMKEKKEMYEESRILKIVLQLVQALRYLHKSKGIIHRDLTPYNIIVGDKDYVTITDFGLAKQRILESSNREVRSILGTLTYVCPEIIQHHPFGEKADIWALGCIVYQICTLNPPFMAQSELELVNKICQLNYVTLDKFVSQFTNEKLNYSLKLQTFIEHCIVLDSTNRYDVTELAALFVEDILISLDDTENLLMKERQGKTKLELQLLDANLNKASLSDMHLYNSSREISPNIDGVPIGSTFSTNNIHCKQSEFSVISKSIPSCSKPLMSISQKSLRPIADDPITRMFTWLHKIRFLSMANFEELKNDQNSDYELLQMKRFFKTTFELIFQLHPAQMKLELNNIMNGKESSMLINSLSNNFTISEFSNISSDELQYLIDDLLEKLNY